jgi:UDP-sugar diphosphatase
MKQNIKNFKLEPLVDAKFISTNLATYEQDGIAKSWEILNAHDSVAILIYHKEKDSFVLVKQFRPAVYMNNNDGMTVELCAGIVDKNISLAQIAQEEVEEECGYRVSLENMQKITSFHTSVGFAGTLQTLFYVEVSDSMKVSDGGGIEQEQIEVIYLPIAKSKDFMYDESIAKTTGLLFSFIWWEHNAKRA